MESTASVSIRYETKRSAEKIKEDVRMSLFSWFACGHLFTKHLYCINMCLLILIAY